MSKKAIIVTGLLFGDETKGATVDYLTAKHNAALVVRYNGGVNAAHNVIADGKHHTFCQVGAGTFAGAKTYLSKHVRVSPFSLVREMAALSSQGQKNIFNRVFIDSQCLITTPYHAAANQIDAKKHMRGTTGNGVGETVEFAIKFPESAIIAADFVDETLLREKLEFVADYYKESSRHPFVQSMNDPISDIANYFLGLAKRVSIVREESFWKAQTKLDQTIIFEGAQGVMLDRIYGFKPHVTSSNCTPKQALDLLDAYGYKGEIEKIGCIRSYATRHGAGIFPQERNYIDSSILPELHNIPTDDHLQGTMRMGWLDMPTIAYAISVSGGFDKLSISHLDYIKRLPDVWQIWSLSDSPERIYNKTQLIETIERDLRVPIKLFANGPERGDRYE